MFTFSELIRLSWGWIVRAGNFIEGWLNARPKQQWGKSPIFVFQVGDESNCRACGSCWWGWCHTCIAGGGNSMDDALLQDSILKENAFDYMLLALQLLHPLFPCQISTPSFAGGIGILCTNLEFCQWRCVSMQLVDSIFLPAISL